MQGRIDAGLLIPPLPDKIKSQLDYLPLLSEPLIVAVPKGLKMLRGKKTVSLQTLSEFPLIIFRAGPRRLFQMRSWPAITMRGWSPLPGKGRSRPSEERRVGEEGGRK